MIRIATRKTPLALAQTNIVVQKLIEAGIDSQLLQIVPMTTQGDLDLTSPLFDKGGKGLFVTDIERALQQRQVDLAVHSLKDLPLAGPSDLLLAGFLAQASCEDVCVSFDDRSSVSPGQIIGTSSLRRAAQLSLAYPDCSIKVLRGSVNHRLKQADGIRYHKVILARAGLERLGLFDKARHRVFCPKQEVVPAFCQGLLALQIHQENAALKDIIAQISCPAASRRQYIERSIAALFSASCQSAFGLYTELSDTNSSSICIFCYKSRTHWKRASLSFSTLEELKQRVQSIFDLSKVDWSQCEEQFY